MRKIAFQTIQRACLFAALAIFCLMVGLSYDLQLSFKVGGALTELLAGILIYKAHEARTKPYRKTEMWLYLPKQHRPPNEYAQWASGTVLRETSLNFALWTAAIAVVMWAIALLLSLAGM